MNELSRTTLRLTIKYSLMFFAFIWLFSGGIYLWVDSSLGEGYVNRINRVLAEQHTSATHIADIPDNAAALVAADVALDRLRNILLAVNVVALAGVPFVAYLISRRTLLPLIESQQSQRRFIANASHELRTPLAVMLAELDWAAKKQRSPREYQSTVQNTRDEVLRMSNLVHSLLLLTRLADQSPQHVERVDVARLAERAIQNQTENAAVRSLTFNNQLNTTAIPGNAELLAVAIANLVENAVKYAPKKSAIAVQTTVNDNGARFSISNAAEGLTPEDVKQLFDRFYQATPHQGHEGFGLGLAIVKQIVEAHHGSVSANLREGTITFTITLRSA